MAASQHIERMSLRSSWAASIEECDRGNLPELDLVMESNLWIHYVAVDLHPSDARRNIVEEKEVRI